MATAPADLRRYRGRSTPSLPYGPRATSYRRRKVLGDRLKLDSARSLRSATPEARRNTSLLLFLRHKHLIGGRLLVGWQLDHDIAAVHRAVTGIAAIR